MNNKKSGITIYSKFNQAAAREKFIKIAAEQADSLQQTGMLTWKQYKDANSAVRKGHPTWWWEEDRRLSEKPKEPVDLTSKTKVSAAGSTSGSIEYSDIMSAFGMEDRTADFMDVLAKVRKRFTPMDTLMGQAPFMVKENLDIVYSMSRNAGGYLYAPAGAGKTTVFNDYFALMAAEHALNTKHLWMPSDYGKGAYVKGEDFDILERRFLVMSAKSLSGSVASLSDSGKYTWQALENIIQDNPDSIAMVVDEIADVLSKSSSEGMGESDEQRAAKHLKDFLKKMATGRYKYLLYGLFATPDFKEFRKVGKEPGGYLSGQQAQRMPLKPLASISWDPQEVETPIEVDTGAKDNEGNAIMKEEMVVKPGVDAVYWTKKSVGYFKRVNDTDEPDPKQFGDPELEAKIKGIQDSTIEYMVSKAQDIFDTTSNEAESVPRSMYKIWKAVAEGGVGSVYGRRTNEKSGLYADALRDLKSVQQSINIQKKISKVMAKQASNWKILIDRQKLIDESKSGGSKNVSKKEETSESLEDTLEDTSARISSRERRITADLNTANDFESIIMEDLKDQDFNTVDNILRELNQDQNDLAGTELEEQLNKARMDIVMSKDDIQEVVEDRISISAQYGSKLKELNAKFQGDQPEFDDQLRDFKYVRKDDFDRTPETEIMSADIPDDPENLVSKQVAED